MYSNNRLGDSKSYVETYNIPWMLVMKMLYYCAIYVCAQSTIVRDISIPKVLVIFNDLLQFGLDYSRMVPHFRLVNVKYCSLYLHMRKCVCFNAQIRYKRSGRLSEIFVNKHLLKWYHIFCHCIHRLF